MLVINYNGKKPSQKEYGYSVVHNSQADIVRFVLQKPISEYSLEQLADFYAFVKVQSAGKEYLDKISAVSTYENECVVVEWQINKKSTHYKNLFVQLQFETNLGNTVAQTDIVSLTLSNTINADEEISDEFPEAIQQMEHLVLSYNDRITQNEEDVAELQEKSADYEERIEALEEKNADLLVSISYKELKSLRDNEQLHKGAFYRITDFVTTSVQENTKSALHQFDIIVQALDKNVLCEDAKAIWHGENPCELVSFILVPNSESKYIRFPQSDGEYQNEHY